MIYSFLYREQIFNLHPISVRRRWSPHLYKSNSIALVVGPNNSGKTDLLAHICHAIAQNQSNLAEVEGHLSEVGVVYYSPAPFDLKRFPKTRSNSRVIIKRRAPKSSGLNSDVLHDLKGEFGFTASVKMKLRSSPEDGIRLLMPKAMEIPNELDRFYELQNSLAAYQRASIEWRRSGEQSESSIETSQESMVGAQKRLKRDVQYLVESRLEDRASCCLVALAHHVRMGGAKEKSARDFWSMLAGDLSAEECLPDLRIFERISYQYGIENLSLGIELDGRVDRREVEELSDFITIEVDGLSSGAEALVSQFTCIAEAIEKLRDNQYLKSIVVLIDEGDAFLHLAWQQRYIKVLDDFISARRPYGMNIQVVVATHSPVLMSDFPRDYILRMNDADATNNDIVSFAAPLERIIENTAGAGSIGRFATGVIKSQLDRGGNADPRIIEWVDDPLLKAYLKKRSHHAG